MENVTLNPKEQARLQVLNSLLAEHMTLDQAATLMGVSPRNTRRILAAYREKGAAAVAHGHRGRKPPNATPEPVATAVVHLGRSLPLRLRRGPGGRARRDCPWLPPTGPRPLPAPRHRRRAHPDRQQRLLPEPHLRKHRGGPGPATEAHAALPASDQRQGGGVHQDPPGRVGLPAAVSLQRRAARRAAQVPCV